jgi:hypothetical protein
MPVSVQWGMAAMCEGEWCYVYGLTQSGFARPGALVVARVRGEDLEHFERWRFHAGAKEWTAELGKAAPVADGLSSEFSVERLPPRNGEAAGAKYVLVHSEPLLGPRIFVRVADSATGPWSGFVAVFTVPEVKEDRRRFTYAAKGHVQLSRPGELLVTYLVNSNDFGDAVRNAAIYRPRFVRVPVQRFLKGN